MGFQLKLYCTTTVLKLIKDYAVDNGLCHSKLGSVLRVVIASSAFGMGVNIPNIS